MAEELIRTKILDAIIELMSDHSPRTGREIAKELVNYGFEIPKSTVNSVLFKEGKVYFGAWVEIENDAREQKTLRIVGVDEIYDHHPQHISIESPMARALLSKQVDDEVEVITALGKKLWYINSIRYEKSQNQ